MSVVRHPQDERSLEELFESVRPTLQVVVARFRIPPEDAEDLLQQALLAYLYKREEVRDPRRWLVATVRNRCLMYLRGRRRRIYRAVDSALLESVAAERPRQEARDLSRDLAQVLARIPDRCRSLLKLRYTLGCEPAEAARVLGYRPSGIYKILERCLAALTRQLVALGLVEGGRPDRPGSGS